jgi:hypothetical protein
MWPSHPVGSRRLFILALGLILTLAGLVGVAASRASAATDPCGAGGNPIACENQKTGNSPDEWDITGAGSDTIQGFSTDISVNAGSPISFKIDTAVSNYTITIYRLGYYDGDGARQVATVTPSATLPQHQPNCITDASVELYDCGNWAVSATWNVPSSAVSGVYIAKLEIPTTGARSHITFVVRNDASHSDIVFQTSDTTWQAYNTYGGSDFYQGAANGRAYKVSYNRPVMTRGDNGGRDFFFSNEYPLVSFLEQNGYDVSYIAGVDTDRRGDLLTNHKVFLSVGHDEYWSGTQRANVEAARDAGVNLQFLSGNEVYWKTRYEASADSSHTAYRTIVCYKETWANAKIDPSDQWTGTYRDPRFAPASKGGGRTENQLTGQAYMSNFSDLAITVSAAEAKLRLWRGTTLTGMTAGQSTALLPSTIGYESDEDLDNGLRPAGLIHLSTTTGAVPQYLQDFGNTTAAGTTTHHLTEYRASSGALVFDAGTIQWTWGLSGEHDRGGGTADPRMQQAQINLFADMGVQPTTLMAGMLAATKSTDTTGPTVTINAPAAGSTQANGTNVTVSGTATDSGGGVVAGVEVSTDAGQTWHAANGGSTWSYTYIQSGVGASSVRVRGMDDSANIGATVTRSLTSACPCSIFGAATPKTAAAEDGNAAELGVRFVPTGDGAITGVRFYKGTGNTGTHVGTLWSSTGQKLASVTFGNETATGWQTASFGTPVSATAGQTYIVSYTAPSGHYAAQSFGFSSGPTDAGALFVSGGFGAQPAGVFGTAGSFPSQSYQNTNYYVDVVYSTTDSSPLVATNQWPLPDSSSVPTTTTISAQFLKPISAGSQSVTVKDSLGNTVAGSTSYDATSKTVTFTPNAALNGFVQYTAKVDATDANGNHLTAGGTWTFRTARPPNAPGVCPCTLFDETTTPTVLDATDGQPLNLGVRFTSAKDGVITGIRFYKAPGHGGAHTATLWSAAGAALATGTFANESSSGWQEVTFTQPVPITKDTQYIASYYSPSGVFSMTPNAFTTDLSRAPLTVTSTAGAYAYGSGFPQGSSANNYLVDPVFELAKPTIAIASQSPAPGAVDVARGSRVTVRFTAPLATGYSVTVSQGGTTLAGGTSLAGGNQLTFTPAQAFAKDVDITVKVAGIASTDGATMPDQTWTFHTSGDDSVSAPQSMFGDLTPATASANDGSPVELGTAFVPAQDGKIKSVRFFKGDGNGGTHTGSVWDSAGNRLGTVTFANETASGWQTANFATPVPVSEGKTYVVSYLAPQGHYATTPSFFTSAYVSGDLTAPATTNGRYLYGGGFPTFSYNATNYFVDVVYVADPPSISVAGRTPASGATDIGTGATASMTFSTAIASGWSMTASAGSNPVAGTAALSADAKTLTFTPSAALPADTDITVTVSGVSSMKGAVLPTQAWTFHTEAQATAFASLFTTQVPATPSASDSSSVEVGTVFTPSVNGQVTGIRFYKGTGNTGTHTGSIWSSTGTRLATVTFANESATGWQLAKLATPLAVSAGQSYVVSYYAPNGHYSTTGSFFTGGFTNGVLSAPATSNGRYLYAANGGFPTNSWNATNYFADVEMRYAVP